MKNNLRRLWVLAGIAAAAVNAFGYAIITGPNGNPTYWDDGAISMSIKLGNSTTLEDGSTYNTSVQAAMTAWNGVLARVQFNGGDAGSGSAGNGDGINELAFASDVFGSAFGSNVLAVTVSYRSSATRGDGSYRRTQSDIIFNNSYTWDSYRGNWRTGTGVAKDLRRVALHELGHVLGLDHPDQASPAQSVSAIMNSTVGDLYALQSDDISGAQSVYGAPGTVTAPTITSQPTNLSVVSGNSGSFSVLASGSKPLVYRWQTAPENTETWTDVAASGFYGGTASSTLYVYPDLSFSKRKYRCVASNSAGSATSDAATLTVTGTAPSVSTNPYSTSITFSGNATFYAYFYGSGPLTYGWQVLPAGTSTWADLTDNSVYSGTKTNYLTITAPPQNYSGNSYRCVANNPLGSANSSAAILTINPAVAPSISSVSSSTTLNYGDYLSLYANVSGSPSPTLQWKKDGVALSGSNYSSYSKSFVTTADAGTYTVTATNIAGTVTSTGIVIAVRDAVGPTITTQPVGGEVIKGNSISLSVGVSGSPTITYQWYRDGQAIAGATSQYYSVSSATAADSGSYSVKVSNPVGNVTSRAVDLVVLPAALPTISGGGGITSLSSQSSSIYFYPSVSGGSRPMTYQWFKDGVPITTSSSSDSSYFSKSGASVDDAGEYTFVVSNEAGIVVSRPYLVTWQEAAATRPWLDSARLGDVAYFLASSPSRIMRYDLARETWLPVAYMPEGKVATAFVPTSAGVFVAYGKQLFRRSLDDQTEVPVYTGAGPISGLCAFGSWVIFAEPADSSTTASTVLVTLDASTLAVVKRDTTKSGVAAALGRGPHPAIAASGLVATSGTNSSSGWSIVKINETGGLDSTMVNPSSYSYRTGTQRYFSPNEAVVFDESGVILDTAALAFKGSVGLPFDGAAFRDDGTLVLLRGKSVRIYSAGDWRESGEALLPESASTLFARGSATFAFSAPKTTTSNPVVRKVSTADFKSLVPTLVANPSLSRFSVEDAYLDSRGVLNLISRSARAVIRWDPTTKSFLPVVPLRATPSSWNFAPSYDRLVFGNLDGAIADLDLSITSPTEHLLSQYSPFNSLLGIAALDSLTLLNIGDVGSSGDSMLMISATGAVAWRGGTSYNGTSVFWDSANRRIFQRSPYYSDALTYSTVSTAGVITAGNVTGSGLTMPLRFSPDDSLILSGNGKIVNFDFQQVVALPNTVVDGAWLSDAFFTIRTRPDGTQVQKWARVTYQPSGTLTLAGTPLKIFELSASKLLVLTLDGGYVTMHIVNSDLTVASTTSNRPPAIVTNRAPSASLVVSSERGLGQALTLTLNVDDADGNFAYANLWVNSPKRGWLALRADNSLVASSVLSSANAVATTTGLHRRRFTFTPTDGSGTYTFALAAVDAAGARTDVANQYVTVTTSSHAPQASFTLSGQRAMNAPLTIQVNVDDEDGDYAYANLWIKTPNRGWLALKADGSLVASAQLSAANSVATTAGTSSRTFTFTPTDGVGVYTFALAAVDAQGQRTDAPVQTITAGDVNHAPTASFTLSSERKIEQTLSIDVTVGDVDGDYAYANLWVRTPNRGWLAIKADGSLVQTSSANAANSVAPLAGTVTRRFAFTMTDGPGSYTFALAAFDSNGVRTDAPSQTITVDPSPAVVGVWTGSSFNLALRSDGTLVGAGANHSRALSQADTTTIANFSTVATGVVAAAPFRTGNTLLYLKSDGTLWAVGDTATNYISTSTANGVPGQVASNVIAVAAGAVHTLALKLDGTLWACGSNSYGELGDGTTTPRSFVQVASNVVAIAAGRYHSLFVKTDGTLWAVGQNSGGQLGDGTTTSRSTPVQMAIQVVAVAAGDSHTLFVKADGSLWGAGYNSYGQLGFGDSTSRTSPAQITTAVSTVYSAESSTFFIKTNGSLWGMGQSPNGQLSSSYYNYSPVQVAATARSAAANYGCGMIARGDGTLSVIGSNSYGQLGFGDTNSRYSYTDVMGGALPVPTAPTTVRGTGGVSSPNLVAWVPVAAAASYEIWRNTSDDSATATKIGTTVNSAFGDTTAQIGTAYYYWVKSVNASGASGFSASVSAGATPNTAPTASFTLSSQRAIGQTITITGTVGDTDGNFAYADLWVKTPNRGWFAIKSNTETVATSALGAAHAFTNAAGTIARTFTFTSADGAGTYMFALAAVDAAGATTFAPSQYITVTSSNVAPTASLTLSSQRVIGQTITISGTVGDTDNNLSYANLWVRTPNRGWIAIKSDNTTTVTDSLGAAHATTTSAGSFTRTFTLTNTDGTGSYMFALAAVDSEGAVTFANSQYATVTATANTAPTASFTLSSERAIGQTITISGTIGDADNNLAYVDLWVKTPNRGWMAIKSDNTTTLTDALGAAHATATATGNFTRTFALTDTDGPGNYMFALAAVDSTGATTFASNQYITVTAYANTAPTASFTLSSERGIGQTITISGTIGDADNNLAYVDLWVKTPNRGWMAIKSDNTTTLTDALGAAHATATTTGNFTRTFALTNTDGPGSYMFALAAVDTIGAVTFATTQYITVAALNHAPTASFSTNASSYTVGDTMTITINVNDEDGNFAYANLWIQSPNRGWLALKADGSTRLTSWMSAEHATTTFVGSNITRTFTFTPTDGAGGYLLALAAIDTSGSITFASNVVVSVNQALREPSTSSASDFETWVALHFTAEERADPQISGPDAVYGTDGMTNLLKYALGIDPKQDGTASMPQTSELADHWFLTYRRPASVTDVIYRVEVSTDLINWSEVGVTQEMILSDATTQTWQAQYQGSPGQTVYLRLNPVRR